jgi:hypothetical protein
LKLIDYTVSSWPLFLWFQSLAVGLSQHKPQDVVQYLLHCLEKVTVIGWQNVELFTFTNEEVSLKQGKEGMY